jgi:hypothetical protein
MGEGISSTLVFSYDNARLAANAPPRILHMIAARKT